MFWFLVFLVAATDPLTSVGGLSDSDIIVVNDTGLYIARLQIDKFTLEEIKEGGKVLIEVTPTRHHMRIVFRGGSDIDWPHFDFKGVHEIFLERHANHIDAHFQ